MPTVLPDRPPSWRRHAPAPETVRNILSTVFECTLALGVVTATVLILAHMDLHPPTGPEARPVATQAGPP